MAESRVCEWELASRFGLAPGVEVGGLPGVCRHWWWFEGPVVAAMQAAYPRLLGQTDDGQCIFPRVSELHRGFLGGLVFYGGSEVVKMPLVLAGIRPQG